MTKEQMEAIARKHTAFKDLSDSYSSDDFTEIAKWTLGTMLAEAYEMGRKSVKEG